MSAIRITRGNSEVEVRSHDVELSAGGSYVRYDADDLMAAVMAALRAMPCDRDRYGSQTRSQEWLAAIEKGAESRGLEVRE